mmetsp:Transcript_4617/g.9614  ORF Transcript_4617/g.9614 Transcript_4617/m.9614 type:complete len:214 (-) Transcript_4617:57-698(-)
MNHSSGESIIHKINTALATLRRERDSFHRKKELAEERLRLVQADRDATEKNITALKEKLRQFQDGTISTRGELMKIEKEVENLRRESKFQHSELMGKKDKLSRIDSKRTQEATTRNVSVSASRESLRRRRELSSRNGGSKYIVRISMEEKKRKLEAMLETDGGHEFFIKLPDLIKMRTEELAEDANGVEEVCVALRRRIVGYEKSLGGSISLS